MELKKPKELDVKVDRSEPIVIKSGLVLGTSETRVALSPIQLDFPSMLTSVVHDLTADGTALDQVSGDTRFKDIPKIADGFTMAGTEVQKGSSFTDV